MLLFIPFIVYGFYKNGIKLYNADYVNLFMMFKPILLVIIGVALSFVFAKVNKEKVMGFRLLSNIMISMIAIPNINFVVYLVLIVLLNFLTKFIKLNIVPVFMVISILIMIVTRDYSFLNSFEASVEHSYSMFDFLLGKGYGGISNTLLLMSIISLLLLIINIHYKKYIPIMAFSVFYVLAIITTFITGSIDQNLLLNNNVIFSFIFLSNISIYTPYSKGACYIYGTLLGLLTFASYFLDINLGVYIVLTILSFISPILDRFIVGKNDHNLVDVL